MNLVSVPKYQSRKSAKIGTSTTPKVSIPKNTKGRYQILPEIPCTVPVRCR